MTVGLCGALGSSETTGGLAAGMLPVPAWMVIGLGALVVVGVSAFLTMRRLARRSSRVDPGRRGDLTKPP